MRNVAVFALILVAALAISAPPKVVARAHTISGVATVFRPGNQPRKLTALEKIQINDVIQTAPNTKTTIWFTSSGKRFALQVPSKVKIAENKLILLSGKAPISLVGIGQKSSSIVAGNSISRQAAWVSRGKELHAGPKGGLRSLNVIQWQTNPDADSYRIIVSKNSAEGEEELISKDVSKTSKSFNVPSGLIKPGVWHRVIVAAMKGDEIDCFEQFSIRILTEIEMSELNSAEAELIKLQTIAPNNDPTYDLMLGELYERFAIYESALKSYEAAKTKQAQLDLSMKISELKKFIGKT